MNKIEAILMPDDDAGICFTLEFCTGNGVWLYTLHKHRRQTFAQHLDALASQWKKSDPDIYAEMIKCCVMADKQTNKSNA